MLDERRGGCCWALVARAAGQGGIGGGRGCGRGDEVDGRGRRGGAGVREQRDAGPGPPAGSRAQEAGRCRSGVGRRRCWRWSRSPRRGDPVLAADVDDAVGAGHRGRADRAGAPVRRRTRCAAAAREQGFSLQGTAKTIEGAAAPGPGRPVPLHQRAGPGGTWRPGDPVISVDTKKKELVGQLQATAGGSGDRRASPEQVRDHDFPDLAAGQGDPVRGLRHGRRHRAG